MLRYEMMLPHQIRAAIEKRWPVVLPLGVLEYHGEHIAGRHGHARRHWDPRDPGKGDGSRHSAAVLLRRRELRGRAAGRQRHAARRRRGAACLSPRRCFSGLLRIGFRNIHVVIHHQTENFAAGMPTDLAFKFAARQAIFAFLEKERGEGWWGREEMADYYARAIGRRGSVQLDQGASADDAGGDGGLSVRPRGRGRDVADDGAVSRRGGPFPAVRRQVVHAIREECERRPRRQGRRACPRALCARRSVASNLSRRNPQIDLSA